MRLPLDDRHRRRDLRLNLQQWIAGRHLCRRLGAGDLHHALSIPRHPRQFSIRSAIDGAHQMTWLRFCKNKDGASAVEFALTVPMFFMMLVGGIECGLLLWTQMGLQHGAEKAARCASIDSTLCGSTSSIQSYA